MGYDPEKHHRRSIRMKGYDYSSPGAYFVTLLSHGRACFFGEIKEGIFRQSDIGKLVNDCWLRIPNHFYDIGLDEYVLMPNHLHGIIFIHESLGKGEAFVESIQSDVDMKSANASPLQPRGTQPASTSAIIQNFKSVSTRMVNKRFFETGNKIWQRNYYERIIRNERELNAIRRYICDNTQDWELDIENLSE
jgi:putative transposase